MGQKVNPISNRLGIELFAAGILTGMEERITVTLYWRIAKSVNI